MQSFTIKIRRFQLACGELQKETDATQIEEELFLPLNGTALLLMDVWATHETGGFAERMQIHCREFIIPVLNAARIAGLPIIHACHDRPESPLTQPRAEEIVLPESLGTRELIQRLEQAGIKNLLYCGYASNWCILHRPEGICAVAGKIGQIIILRDASIGFETPESFDGKWCHYAAVNMVESQFGYSASNEDFIAALSGSVPSLQD